MATVRDTGLKSESSVKVSRVVGSRRKSTSLGSRSLCVSEDAMVQQVAHLIARGYFFWSAVLIPGEKNVEDTDRKLLERYCFSVCKTPLEDQKKHLRAKCRYLRFERWGILLATSGAHPFFLHEKYRDCRRRPIPLFGYSIGHYRGSLSVRLQKRQIAAVEEHLLGVPPTTQGNYLRALPILPYGGVKAQLFALLKRLNQRRSELGLEPLGYDSLPPLKRRQLKVFD